MKSEEKKSEASRRTLRLERPGKYNAVSAMTNAQSGIPFGQLWPGDVVNAKRELDGLLSKSRLKFRVLGENLNNIFDKKEDKGLTVVMICGHDTYSYPLLGS